MGIGTGRIKKGLSGEAEQTKVRLCLTKRVRPDMKTYKILCADFSVWKHLMYLPLAEAAVARDTDAQNPVLFIIEVGAGD
jgi:hypothetical protein